MNPSPIVSKAATTACVAAWLLAGCVVAPVGPHGGYPAAGGVITVAPPAPRYEVVGIAPVAGNVWISGYWGWSGAAYAWAPGYWTAPRPGHVWVPHTWMRHGQGWRMAEGHWRRT